MNVGCYRVGFSMIWGQTCASPQMTLKLLQQLNHWTSNLLYSIPDDRRCQARSFGLNGFGEVCACSTQEVGGGSWTLVTHSYLPFNICFWYLKAHQPESLLLDSAWWAWEDHSCALHLHTIVPVLGGWGGSGCHEHCRPLLNGSTWLLSQTNIAAVCAARFLV